MLSLLKLFLIIYLLISLVGVILSVILFIFDVFRWHDREQRVKITPSNSPVDSFSYSESSLSTDFDISLESEVTVNDSQS